MVVSVKCKEFEFEEAASASSLEIGGTLSSAEPTTLDAEDSKAARPDSPRLVASNTADQQSEAEPKPRRPRYSNTAKVVLFHDYGFQGAKGRYQVLDNECYNLPAQLKGYVLSAKLDPKIWFCTFFPARDCKDSEVPAETHRLMAGEYEELFPDGMDFVSFSCSLYAKEPGAASARVDAPVGEEQESRQAPLWVASNEVRST